MGRYFYLLLSFRAVVNGCFVSPFEQAANRKKVLEDSYRLQRFLADYRDLISWTNDTKTIIQSDELAKDVAGAEALLERHQEHKGFKNHYLCPYIWPYSQLLRLYLAFPLIQNSSFNFTVFHPGEIDARIDSFKVALAAGEDLVVTDHYAKDEVAEKMEKLQTERDALLKLWEDRRISYEQCMDLMLFYRGKDSKLGPRSEASVVINTRLRLWNHCFRIV